jgi:hypothetical protein
MVANNLLSIGGKTVNVNKNRKDWGKGENPFCEVHSVQFPKEPGGPIAIVMTDRGMKELARREAVEKREQARIRRMHVGNGTLWFRWLFGPYF